METLFPYATRDIHNFKLRTFGDGAIVDTNIFISELQSIENANVRVISKDKKESDFINLFSRYINVALVVDGNGEEISLQSFSGKWYTQKVNGNSSI